MKMERSAEWLRVITVQNTVQGAPKVSRRLKNTFTLGLIFQVLTIVPTLQVCLT
jgi:hypothetical protein